MPAPDAGRLPARLAKLDAAAADLARDKAKAFFGSMGAFENQVRAQRDKKIPASVADRMLADAEEILDLVNG